MARDKKVSSALTLFDKHLGSRIRMQRLARGMSQEKLGDALGLTFQQVQKYEKGSNRVSAGRLWHLSKIFDVPITFFYEGAPDIGGRADGMREPVSTGYVYDFLNTREGAALGHAFSQIKSGKARRAILDLAEECAQR
jgi:transcriptional regulator with XRE-family HTH domain